MAWRDNQSLLLLIRESPQRSSVFSTKLDFHPSNIRQVQAFPREGEFFDEFVYLPR